MPICRATAPLTPERSAAILAEALRRGDASIPGPLDLDVLRQALETERGEGPCPLVRLIEIGCRRAVDRIGRATRKEFTRS